MIFHLLALALCASASADKCSLQNNTDFNGNDLGQGKSKSVGGCCAECLATPGCNAFSVWIGPGNGAPACYLKRNANGKRAIADHVSGLVDNPNPNPNPAPPHPPPSPPHPAPPNPAALKNATDCAMRSLFVSYAATVNPIVDAVKRRAMAEALEGDPMMGAGCRVDGVAPSPPAPTPPPPPYPNVHCGAVCNGTWWSSLCPTDRVDPGTCMACNMAHNAELVARGCAGNNCWSAYCDGQWPATRSSVDAGGDPLQFVADPVNGNDSAAGTLAAPFKTVLRAVEAVRNARKSGATGTATVALRAGVFHLPQTLALTADDSDLVVQTHSADAPNLAWLSGAAPLTGVTWTAVNITGGANVWAADLSHSGFNEVPGLRLDGRRLWRARYPNGDPETTMPFKRGLMASRWLPSPTEGIPPVRMLGGPKRTDGSVDAEYTMATGGTACSKYTPPISHYCAGNNDGGGGAIIADAVLPHAPYANPKGAIITAMHGGLWCSFAYKISNSTHKDGSSTFTFSEGGQQCNRPEGSHGQLVVEGPLEELDEAGEFHFDPVTKRLTLFHNASAGTPPPTNGSLEVLLPEFPTLVSVTGTHARPAVGIRLDGLGFRDTAAATFLPHMAPTGGDWAVNRFAAVVANGTVGFEVSGSTFWRLDNAGIFLGGYQRGTVVAENEFAWLGESGIVSVGDTTGDGNYTAFPGFGWDGSAGNQPRGTLVRHNFAHELGIINKQSAFYFQAATDNTTLDSNIIFNGARSGINFNDAFGSGSNVERNVLFNLNRETADHGCFNSWDRLPFYPEKNATNRDVLARNMALSNFNSYNGLDTDDDSAFYHMLNNVLLYGHVLKSDFSGHDIEYEGDLGVFTAQSNQYQAVSPAHTNALHNSVFISEHDGDVLFSLTGATCNQTSVPGSAGSGDFPRIANLKVYSPTGTVTLCGESIVAMEARGMIKNVTTAPLSDLSAASVVARAKVTLGVV